jgi:hypothetical protein
MMSDAATLSKPVKGAAIRTVISPAPCDQATVDVVEFFLEEKPPRKSAVPKAKADIKAYIITIER